MTSTVLVTGGAGYIGSHTVRALTAAGRDVVVLDSLELGDAHAVIDAPLVVGDIADHDLVTAICQSTASDRSCTSRPTSRWVSRWSTPPSTGATTSPARSS